MGNYSHPLLTETKKYTKEYLALTTEVKGFKQVDPLGNNDTERQARRIAAVLVDKGYRIFYKKQWNTRRITPNTQYRTFDKIRLITYLEIYEKLNSPK